MATNRTLEVDSHNRRPPQILLKENSEYRQIINHSQQHHVITEGLLPFHEHCRTGDNTANARSYLVQRQRAESSDSHNSSHPEEKETRRARRASLHRHRDPST